MSNTFKGKFLSIFLSLLLILSLAAVVLPATPAKAAVTGVNITSPTNAVPLYGHTGGTLAIGFTVTATDITQGDLLLEVLTAGTSTAVATQPLYAVTLAIGVNTFSYSIGLTGVATGTYDVKVSALQPTGGGIWQASDIESNALVIDNTIPTVTLTNPNGGNYVSSSKDYTVYWNATDTVPAQDVYVGAMYSTDAGTSYPSTAFTTVPKARGTNSATWLAADIPDMDTLSARLQLTVTDTAGNSRVVTSASNFTIINSPPTVTISTPTTGTSWNGNSTQSITFTTVSTFSTNVDYKIELSLDSGGTYPTLITDWVTNRTPGLTTYSWKVDNTYRGSTAKIRVTVRDKAGNEGTPAISNAFTIADVTAPTVSVTAPTVGTIFYAGQTNQTISWTASDNVFSIGSVDQLLNYNIQL